MTPTHEEAAKCLSALSHTGRLEVFRIIAARGAQGIQAGDVARAIKAPANTTSSHLKILSDAGFLTSIRRGRQIIYSTRPVQLVRLSTYLSTLTPLPLEDGPAVVIDMPDGFTATRGLNWHELGLERHIEVTLLCQSKETGERFQQSRHLVGPMSWEDEPGTSNLIIGYRKLSDG